MQYIGGIDNEGKIYRDIEKCSEEIKAKNQLKWVGLMNNIKAQAEEFVLRDFVYSMEGRR